MAGPSMQPGEGLAAGWHGAGWRGLSRGPFRWSALAWALVFPRRLHRIVPTVTGTFLIAVALAIGMAAYNTSSNILFLTLALLLACLLLNGLMSWFNFMGVRWRLRAQAPWRAGHTALVAVETRNEKRWLPTYGLWFEVEARARNAPGADDGKPRVREAFAEAESATTRGRLCLGDRLDPAGGEARLEWVVRPEKRGPMTVGLTAVGSCYPFGFLRKRLGAHLSREVLVWPAQIAYDGGAGAVAASRTQGERVARAGMGDDLLALRKYRPGDSHRLIHWKASARLRQLMVRQFAAEAHDGYWLSLDAPAAVWPRAAQFERLCSLAATMAEDLFAAGKLRGIAVGGGPARATRQVRDVEAFLDELAVLEPHADGGRPPGRAPSDGGAASLPPRNVITFAPAGAQGVTAYVDGIATASA